MPHELQAALDEWLERNNNEFAHQSRWCNGKCKLRHIGIARIWQRRICSPHALRAQYLASFGTKMRISMSGSGMI